MYMTKHVIMPISWLKKMAIIYSSFYDLDSHGQSTIAMEIFKDLPTVDIILALSEAELVSRCRGVGKAA